MNSQKLIKLESIKKYILFDWELINPETGLQRKVINEPVCDLYNTLTTHFIKVPLKTLLI